MRSYLFLPSVILCVVLFYLPTNVVSQGDNSSGETSQSTASTLPGANINSIPAESQNQVITLTNKGLEPAVLTMKKEDSTAFFLNDSEDSLVTLEINFGELTTHCSSANLKIGDDKVIRSIKPVGPKDFANTCFHERGTYTYKVFGLNNDPAGLSGTIYVE